GVAGASFSPARPPPPPLIVAPRGTSHPTADLFRLSLGPHPLALLLQPAFHHSTDQLVRNGLVEGELQVPLLPAITRQFLVEFLVPPHRGEDPDVLFERGKVDQIAVLGECRHLVADFLGGLALRLLGGSTGSF